MAATSDVIQTITRLTPLAEVLATIDSGVRPVAACTIDVVQANGRTLAADVPAPSRPNAATALQDGWALTAAETVGASGYAPVQVLHVPQRIEAGNAMPAGTDSVAPYDAVTIVKDRAEALVTISPGDGVLPAGGDSDAGRPLLLAGARLRRADVATLTCAGFSTVSVRTPRIRVVPLRGGAIVAAAAHLVAGDIEGRGGVAQADEPSGDLRAVLQMDGADAIIAIGGTGSGRNDASARTLASEGRLAIHGMALTPGETAALGFSGPKPVLLLPGRLDAALAVWLVVGRRMLARLAGATLGDREPAETITLARKVVSTVGLAEIMPLRRVGDSAKPLAAKYLPLSSLASSNGWILVPAESEGYPAGTQVRMRAWP